MKVDTRTKSNNYSWKQFPFESIFDFEFAHNERVQNINMSLKVELSFKNKLR